MDATILRTMANDLLKAARDAYNEVSGSHPAPARQLIAHGVPAHDCDALIVWLERMPTQQQPNRGKCGRIVQPTFNLEVSRCYPTADGRARIPTGAEEQRVAELLLDDLWTINHHLTSEWSSGTLFRSFTGIDCEDVQWQPVIALNNQGGIAGWRMPIVVTLTGYRRVPE